MNKLKLKHRIENTEFKIQQYNNQIEETDLLSDSQEKKALKSQYMSQLIILKKELKILKRQYNIDMK